MMPTTGPLGRLVGGRADQLAAGAEELIAVIRHYSK
jgi:DNA-directed RNA polymerase subunit K/omega